jgi:SNF2 family DNA or RNA helicase
MSSKEAEDKILEGENFIGKIFIISYNLLTREPVLDLFKRYQFKSNVFDESHCLKHIGSKRTKAGLALSKLCRRIVLLSGTPASRPAELYSQIKMIHPWMFPKWFVPFPKTVTTHEQARAYTPKLFGYANDYCDPFPIRIPGRHFLQWRTEKGVGRLSEISSIAQHYLFIRRLKAEVCKQLPKLNRTRMVLVPDEKELRQAQEDLLELERMDLGSSKRDAAFSDLFNNKLPRLKWPLLETYFTEQFSEGEMSTDPSVKCLIFAHHKYILHKLDDLFTKIKVPHILMYGETPTDKRDQGIHKFQTSAKCRVAILGIQAFKEGVNLDKASRVFMAEMMWDPKDMLQAECRAHRMNSQKVVDVEYLLVQGTMDMIIWQQLDKKQTQADVITDPRFILDSKHAANVVSLPSRYVVHEKSL